MYFHFQMPLIASLLCLLLSFCLFICNPSLHRNQRDFQDGLPLINLSGCAQPSFPAGIKTRNERLQSEPFVQQEGVYTALYPQSVMVVIQKMKRKLPNVIQMWFSENKKIEWIFFQPIKLSISQTPDEDNSRTYASLDESTTDTAWNNPNTVPYVGLIQSVHKVVYRIYKEVFKWPNCLKWPNWMKWLNRFK